MMYFANPVAVAIPFMLAGRLGYIDTPLQGNKRPNNVWWCADNGCFNDARFDPDAWFMWLERHADDSGRCVFAAAPDVYGDAAATLERSAPWLPKIRGLGYSVAYVAQDGSNENPPPWHDFDALFIGGTNEFKLGEHSRRLITEAKWRGKWVHCGRVNSYKRYAAMTSLGCDSADGTYLVFGPEINLPKVLG